MSHHPVSACKVPSTQQQEQTSPVDYNCKGYEGSAVAQAVGEVEALGKEGKTIQSIRPKFNKTEGKTSVRPCSIGGSE